MTDQLLLIVCAAGAVGLLAFFVLKMCLGREDDGKLRTRLSRGGPDPLAGGGPKPKASLVATLKRMGEAASQPFMPASREKQSAMRERMGKAGIYAPSAVRVMQGAKVILLGLGVVGGYAAGVAADKLILFLALGGLIGYLAPQMWLRSKIKANQQALTYGLADALDLMVVCVEAGLTVDAAMQRVGQELGIAHPAMAREFGIAHMETRLGLGRGEALKNMGHRTGCPALQSLVAMLVQADRFGTSIAQALRVHAETLRMNRQHAAEEMAAKASVKISFPLVLCIFPSTFIVLCGPTVMDLMNSSLFK